MSDHPQFSATNLATAGPEEFARAGHAAIAAARAGIERVRAGLDHGLDRLETYDEAIAALADFGALSHLFAKAHPDAAMRTAGEAAEQQVQKVATDIALDRGVYDALTAVDLTEADAATRHWVTRLLRDFRRAGVDRDDATRARVRQLHEELVEIGQSFARNINSDTRSARFSPDRLAGLPDDWVAAHPVDAQGQVTVTTDYPDVLPFLAYAHDADARRELWTLFRQRGHPANIEVLRRLLERRHELATLLGYPSWAAYATEDKMIGTAQAAAAFIERISEAAADRMRQEYDALLARKRRDDPDATTVDPWDNAYLQERVKAEQYTHDSLALRPYFEFARVREGVLAVAAKLFGVTFRPRPEAPVWHPEVVAYDVCEGEDLLGRIYLDLHPRPDKFSHAAMFSMVTGKAGRRVPECALVCNFPRPGELLRHSDVETFFHEFGHLLHHIFGGRQRWAGLSGVRTEWDFVEAPSQLLEEWTRDPATLATFAVHHETGEPLPAELITRLRAAEEFGKGLFVRQQMFYAALSLELYRRDPASVDPAALERELQERHTPFAYVDGAQMHLSFGHLDGYSAIYYTYMWSLVIAKDLFTGFDPTALLAPEAATRYRKAVLAAGGSAPAADLIRDFLGRAHTFDAYQAWLDAEPTPV